MNIALAITGIGIVSKYGLGVEVFVTGINRESHLQKEAEDYVVKDVKIPSFNIKELLGNKTRYINKTTGLSLVAMNQVLEQFPALNFYNEDEVGIAVGTNTGSLKITLDFANDTFIQEKPFYVDPSHFPQGILNYMAGTAAIKYGFKGVNVTLSDGRMTGYEVLKYTSNVLNTNQSSAMIVGTVEDSNEYSEHIYHLQNEYRKLPDKEHAEGAVFLGIETLENAKKNNQNIIAEIIDSQVLYYSNVSQGQALKIIVDKMLAKHNVNYEDIYAVSLLDNIEKDGSKFLKKHLPADTIKLSVSDVLGDCLSISCMFQIVSLLQLSVQTSRKKYCLAYSLDENLIIGCALIKL